MQKPVIITKKFMLAGFEAEVDCKDEHWPGMDFVKKSLNDNVEKLDNLVQPVKYYGLWLVDPNADYTKKENHSKRLYFHGVEVTNLDNIPTNFTVKNFPECSYAIFKENVHGSPKYEWLEAAGYKKAQNFHKYVLDFEIHKTLNIVDGDDGDEWEVGIPIEYQV